jgi:hypothetical protein
MFKNQQCWDFRLMNDWKKTSYILGCSNPYKEAPLLSPVCHINKRIVYSRMQQPIQRGAFTLDTNYIPVPLAPLAMSCALFICRAWCSWNLKPVLFALLMYLSEQFSRHFDSCLSRVLLRKLFTHVSKHLSTKPIYILINNGVHGIDVRFEKHAWVPVMIIRRVLWEIIDREEWRKGGYFPTCISRTH